MCPFCGEYLKTVGDCSSCSCGYIETTEMSYEEICDKFSDNVVSFKNNSTSYSLSDYITSDNSDLPF